MAQEFPQLPQCAVSVAVLVQAPPQADSPAGQLQTPLVQLAPMAQSFPQLPQWATSDETSTQVPAQSI